ncbi:hypothetical protein AMTRI_Chr03g142350 [Amborella trichopoda]
MQPPPNDQLTLNLVVVNGNPVIDELIEDTDAWYLAMVAVMGGSFNAINGEGLTMIKDNVEAPANNVADGEERQHPGSSEERRKYLCKYCVA